ncbi:MAG: GNAT family N-acetyltransferase [Alphaproteobacteria bacterium]|nr:GNAT family N-acetyltransferase [Alphaproteobacteria bacterium]
MAVARALASPHEDAALSIRPARAEDIAAVSELDAAITGLAKPAYWRDLFERYGTRRQDQRFFLVAESDGEFLGFAIGEIRAWEFGAPPCGWLFAIDVKPDARLTGVGTALFHALCERFRAAGIDKLRTMLARDNHLMLSFFRSQGMMAGPSIQLEMALDDP